MQSDKDSDVFKITNKKLAEACYFCKDHPYFTIPEGDNNFALKAMLQFRALELYFQTYPEAQSILQRFVDEKLHLQNPYKKQLNNSNINPLKQIIVILRDYAKNRGYELDEILDPDNIYSNDTHSKMLADNAFRYLVWLIIF